MKAGQLNQRINIEQRTSSQDALGQPIETWSLVAAVWANIRHVSGVESIKASADVSTVNSSVRIRYRTGVDAGMRIVKGADVYQINAVLIDGNKQFVDLVCELIK